MATRRKYRTQKLQAYRDGGAVRELGQIPDDAGPSLKAAAAADFEAERGAAELEREAAAIEREREGTAAPASPTIAPPDDGNPLLVALHASRKAEELQRQRTAAPQADHHAYVDGLQISERKKEFLRANPELMRPDLAPIARKIYQQALAAGVPDDSAQIERAVLEGVMHEIGAVQRTAPAPSPPPAIEPKRERIPVSAPVSRTLSAATGGRDPGSRTLFAEERQVARNSFSDPSMSNEAKEFRYWQNREKYKAMKKDGSYSVQHE